MLRGALANGGLLGLATGAATAARVGGAAVDALAASTSGRAAAPSAAAAARRWLLAPSGPAAAAAQLSAATDVERAIAGKIAAGLRGATAVRVEDTSGGCGTMYSIEVTASDFEGKPKIKQHQLVAKLIADDVAQWHGFQLVTKAP